jgi:uncharacterized membrane protein YoaT (DUF817 family)
MWADISFGNYFMTAVMQQLVYPQFLCHHFVKQYDLEQVLHIMTKP